MNTAPRILVVDDDANLTLAVSTRLRSAGFEVQVCHSAADAASVAVRMKPDVILLDVEMPGYTGLELHECFQFAARLKDTPVIYLSGKGSLERTALAQGARAFIPKPYDPERLISTVRSVIGPGQV